jgi:hypothetical protein
MSAPVSAAMLLGARVLSLWLIGMPWIAVVVGVGCLGLGLGPVVFVRAAGLGWLLLAVSVPVGFAAGVYLGRSDWRHPRQMLTLGGRMILLALLFALAGGFWLMLQISGPAQDPGGTLIPGDPVSWGWAIAGGAVVAGLFSWVAWRRLRSLEWLH